MKRNFFSRLSTKIDSVGPLPRVKAIPTCVSPPVAKLIRTPFANDFDKAVDCLGKSPMSRESHLMVLKDPNSSEVQPSLENATDNGRHTVFGRRLVHENVACIF